MKKTVSIITVLAILLSISVNVFAFTDVPKNHWAYNEIQYFREQNIVNGIDENTFAPNDNVTREQLAKLISIIYGKSDYKANIQTFSDVSPDMWSYNYIESVKEYLTGYYPVDGEPFYNPTASATREDVAYALVKISALHTKITPDENVLNKYADNQQISYNLRNYLSVAVQSGLINGYTDGTIRPQEGITRAETVTLLFRAIKKPVEDEVLEPEKAEINPEKEPEIKQEETPVKETEKITDVEGLITYNITDIEQIDGYIGNEVKGKIVMKTTLTGEYADFDADLKITQGLNYMTCKVELVKMKDCDQKMIHGLFNMYIDGTLHRDHDEGTVQIKNGKLILETEEGVNLVAYLEGKRPTETPEENTEVKPEKEYYPSLNGAYMLFKISDYNGEKVSGQVEIGYSISDKKVDFDDIEFKTDNDSYVFKITDVLNFDSDEITVKYTMLLNEEIIEENAEGKFDNISASLGEYVSFITTGGKTLKLYMVEIEDAKIN